MPDSPKIAIIGGGAGGLSLARLLKDVGLSRTVVFEAEDRVGGKSWTFYRGGSVAELGTCYTTLAHRVVKKWMAEYGMKLRRNGVMKFDGSDFIDYVKKGGGAPLPVQAARYLMGISRLKSRLLTENPTPEAIEEASTTTLDWLRARRLEKMELFLERIVTINGYGHLDETTIVQSARWCDLPLVVSGAFNQLHMPVQGWSALWDRIARDLDVKVSTAVEAVERTEDGVFVTSKRGRHHFDYVVCTIPIDEFSSICEPTPYECSVNQSIVWQGYATSLVASDNWFNDWQVEGYSGAIRSGAPRGMIVGARLEANEPELGGRLYVTGQLSRGLEPHELKEMALADLENRGVNVTNFVMQKTWKYFAQYKSEAVRNGLLSTLAEMQGDRRTWYTGATFSHEAVSHIVNFNVSLARHMRERLVQ